MSWTTWLVVGIALWFALACGLSYAFARSLVPDDEPEIDAEFAHSRRPSDDV